MKRVLDLTKHFQIKACVIINKFDLNPSEGEGIEAFAKERKLAYRTDHSNSSTKYVRNKIRHEILPLFEEINPDFRRSVHKTINRIRETEMVYNNAIAEKRNELIEVEGNRILIPISKLFELNPINTYLYELLSPFGFNSDAVADILSSLKGESGKQFLSASHLLVKDRLLRSSS